MRILLVEDSATLNEALVRSLRQQGWVCDSAADGLTALQFLTSYRYDAVLLDLMLPCLDGWGVLRKLRAAGQAVPVLVISARDQVADRVQALDNGADDYLVKPFALDELLARLRALLRRPAHQEAAVLQHGELSIDAHARTVRWRGQDVALTPKEYALLELLLRERGRVHTRNGLFERLYAGSSTASDKVIEVLVSTLRAKLARAGVDGLIETRRGFGYVVV